MRISDHDRIPDSTKVHRLMRVSDHDRIYR